MAITVAIRKRDGAKMIRMHDMKSVQPSWMTPAYARSLARRLLVEANMAEIVIFSPPPKRSSR